MILTLVAKDPKDLRAYKLGQSDMARAVDILKKLQFMAGQTMQPGQLPNDVAVYLVPEELIQRLTDGDTNVLAPGVSTFVGKAPLWMSAEELVKFLELARIQATNIGAQGDQE